MYSQKIIATNRAKLEAAMGMPLKTFSEDEVLDFSFRMKDIDWIWDDKGRLVPSRPLAAEEEVYIWNERLMCKLDFLYWAARYCWIIDDAGRLATFKPWLSQRDILKILAAQEEEAYQRAGTLEAKIRLILLKSRQVGGTVFSEGVVAHQSIFFPNTRSVIASDHPDNTLKLFRVLTNMIDRMPGWLKPRQDARVKANNLHFDLLESDVICGSGNQKTTLGQGMTVDVCHLTEVSTWDVGNADQIDEDLRPAFNSSRRHHSIWIMESTGAGARGNWFHDQFQAALSGDSLFKPIFVGWFRVPEKWTLDPTGVEIGPETHETAERIRRETGVQLTKGQLAWHQVTKRDFESRGKLEVFFQEYPSTIEEAFQTGLRSVFSLALRAKMRDAIKLPIGVYELQNDGKKLRKISIGDFVSDISAEKELGKLLVWEWTRPGFVYLVGVDASHGIEGGDLASIQVLRVGNKWEPDEQVAEWTGELGPIDLANVCELVGKLYLDREIALPAKLAVECNPGSPGVTTQIELIRRGYPHFYRWKRPLKVGGGFANEYGWWTTPGTRTPLVGTGVEYIEKGWLKVNSPFFVSEMGSFVKTQSDSGRVRLEAAPGYHDDRIMALFIALYVAHDHDMRNIADDRRRAEEQRNIPPAEVRNYQELGIPWEEACARWEEDMQVGQEIFY